ncbi:hypothetical protein RD792_010865 [Penstemon davidsonii]|uniref:cytokinin dehydrogenase n=1 Tax=Penstemon davidsonii TaxID=160366 RepID=A0ABR0D2Z8_9LAMI|nr:hypothetical protein RD792_010865 [Penstemon davidsonii]
MCNMAGRLLLLPNEIFSLDISTKLHNDHYNIKSASTDYGNLIQEIPTSVFHPSSIDDIINLIKFSNNCSTPFTIAAKGRGHSVRGQAMARDGVVVEMTALSKKGSGIRVSWNPSLGYYADVGGEQLWIDVLHATLEHGLAPMSWTDYLYLTVGGTLSNGGISGQSFLYGPQISNVLELDVITGEVGQIDLQRFRDIHKRSRTSNRNRWPKLCGSSSLLRNKNGLLYAIEVIKYYDDDSVGTIDQELELLVKELNYIPGHMFKKDVSFVDFLSRVKSTDDNSNSGGHEFHPWLNLFVPKSSIMDFNDGVFLDMIRDHNHTSGLVLFYPLNRKRKFRSVRHHHKSKDRPGKSTNKNDTSTNNWRSFISSASRESVIAALLKKQDVPFVDFLNRVALWDSPKGKNKAHPWLNLFIPKSQILAFNDDFLVNMLPKLGLYILYPLNKNKWDDRMSVVIPDEDIFYVLALVHSS